jgi:hypothetical protein
MAKKKRHHTLSEFYLRGFALDREHPLLVEYNFERSEILELHPDEISVHKNFYALDGVDDEHKLVVEETFQGLESLAAPIIRALEGSNHTIEGEDRDNLAVFIAAMMLRVPAIKHVLDHVHSQTIKLMARALSLNYDVLHDSLKKEIGLSKEELMKVAEDPRSNFKIPRNMYCTPKTGSSATFVLSVSRGSGALPKV